MPFINVHVGKQLTAEQKRKLADLVGEKVTLLPTKNINNTMIEISGGRDMYNGGEPREMIFVDMRLMGPSPLEAKDAFVAALSEGFFEILGIPADRQYYNLIELTSWGACGHMREL